MAERKRVAILFGGRSTEHQISLLSAKNVINAIDRELFDPVLIAIDKSGKWHLNEGEMKILNKDSAKDIKLDNLDHLIVLSQNSGDRELISLRDYKSLGKIDVLFPVLHGTFGEDGSIQGLAKLANLPIVGCGILGSSVGMDKDTTKRLLRDAGIKVADFITLRKGYNDHLTYDEISIKLGKELFIKPANLGSSVGVSFVKDEASYKKAVDLGFKYDYKVIVEEKIVGREIEVAIKGHNADPKASAIGEVIPKSAEFYDFEAKYVSADGALCEIPASNLSDIEVATIQNRAIEIYRLLECEGLTRVDMFYTPDKEIYLNEVNTLPGFTSISMYPKLWEQVGIPYKELITDLITIAIERQERENQFIQAE
jgi:D-alanine-D-alanine ligase